jgi:hypothetical protein
MGSVSLGVIPGYGGTPFTTIGWKGRQWVMTTGMIDAKLPKQLVNQMRS